MNNDDKILITIDAREINLYNDIINRDLDNYKDKIDIISENLNCHNYELKWSDKSIIDYNDLIYIGLEGKNFELYSINYIN